MIFTSFIDKYRKMFMSFATNDVVRLHGSRSKVKAAEIITSREIATSSSPGVCDTEYEKGRRLIVSLTTFSTRIEWVALAIESIMDQSIKANRIILWLGHEFEADGLIPSALHSLCRRGLEIRFTDDIGPATKLIPALREFPNDLIVTIDDDTIYSFNLLDKLLRGHRRHPKAVISDWVDKIGFGANNKLEYSLAINYNTEWGDRKPDLKPVALGVSGVLYPPGCLHPDVFDIAKMLKLTPHADDLWFKTMELRAGTPVYCTGTIYPFGDRIYGLKHIDESLTLYSKNLINNGNERQLEKLLANYPDAFNIYK